MPGTVGLIRLYILVKLTPGTGKRGKACKTALAMFLADKTSSSRNSHYFVHGQIFLFTNNL